jgi:hypothetical protein
MTMMTPNQIGSKPSSLMTGEDDRHGQDDHGERIHQAAEYEIHQHDEREHAIGADAEAGEELRHLLRRLGHGEEIAEQQRADQHREHGGGRRSNPACGVAAHQRQDEVGSHAEK